MMNSEKEMIPVLLDLRSVYNVGSVFRTADALGIKEIYLVGTTPTPKDRFGFWRKDMAKVALGAEKNISWRYFANHKEAIDDLRRRDFMVVALEQSDKSRHYAELSQMDKIALALGNEPDGIDKDTLVLADTVVEIPMYGKKESLNVAVAFAVAGYKFFNI